ncbi:nucleoside-diphosphate kinase [Candidatus Clostridium radicumherbarum]|uniref:nucleoside-diphosphate kinase n=1 Tax=Candidatus Clostridium radicumherbarum TaxID=3381662 RepID=A0ABW8TPW7_9CLOT
MERTLILVKPDGVERKLLGEIISHYERKGLNIIALELILADTETAKRHYEEHVGKPYFEELIKYITENKLCALVVEGENAVEIVRKINGDKDPLKSDLGSIRGKFSIEKTRNLVHASDSAQSAKREIGIWFPKI